MTRIFIFLSLLIISASCGSVKVTSDYDKTADFSSYKSYAFTDNAYGLPLDDLNRNMVLKAIERALAEKGFTQRENNPDVLIDINVKADQKESATAITGGGYGGYGSYGGYAYGYGYPYAWGGGFSTSSIKFESYTDGTLFIDIIDASKKQLVWQGRGTKTLEPDASQEKREANLNYALKEIFMLYPPKN